MPLYILKIKADLENIEILEFTKDTVWKFDVESDSSEIREGITFCRNDEMELEGSRGTAHFIMKWDRASTHQSYIKIVDVKKVTGNYTAEQSGTFVTILGMECRGLSPKKWIPGPDCIGQSAGGKAFEVDLTELDWADYDERNEMAVSVTNLEYSIERA